MDNETHLRALVEQLEEKCKEASFALLVLVEVGPEDCMFIVLVPEGSDGPVRALHDLVESYLASETSALGLEPEVDIA